MKTTFLFSLIALGILSVTTSSAQWTKSSDITGGQIQSLSTLGSDLFALSEPYGVYRSTDGGGSWFLAGDFSSNYYVWTMFADANGLYLGTAGDGAFRSSDNGAHWTPINNGLGSKSTRAFASFGSSVIAADYDQGIYRSTDAGASWTKMGSLPSMTYKSLAANATSIFAGTSGSGIYRTTNGGVLWTQVWAPPYSFPGGYAWANALLVNGSTILAGTSNGMGIYRSSDNGDTWRRVDSSLSEGSIRALVSCGGKTFAATSAGVLVSSDAGLSWTAANQGLTYKNLRSLTASHDTVFAGTSGFGVFRSTDLGLHWSQMNQGLLCSGITFNGLETTSDLSGGSYLYAATWGAGLFRSTDYGASWSRTSLDNPYINILSSDGKVLYAATGGQSSTNECLGGIYRSTDHGVTWANIDSTQTDINALAGDASAVYSGAWGIGVYRSLNAGAQWSTVNNGLTNFQLDALAFDDSLVFAGCWGGGSGLFVSTNAGDSWSPRTNGLPHDTVQFIAIAKDSATSVVVASLWDKGVYRSTDAGASWTPSNTGLTDSCLLAFVARGSTVIARSWSDHVFLSTNKGFTWAEIGQQLAGRLNDERIAVRQHNLMSVHATTGGIAAVTANADYVFIGTTRQGVYRCPIADLFSAAPMAQSQHPRSSQLWQNYPNPFNPETRIRYAIARACEVSLNVYDLLGRRVASLVQESKMPGTYDVTWDATGFASGPYFYTLRAGNVVETKRLILLH